VSQAVHEELASSAWLVKVDLRLSDQNVEARYFAVAAPGASAAATAVSRFPGVSAVDPCVVVRALDEQEIRTAGLKEGAVRPFVGLRIGKRVTAA
jgi:hypothetical protein